jgi:hypothetical protein
VNVYATDPQDADSDDDVQRGCGDQAGTDPLDSQSYCVPAVPVLGAWGATVSAGLLMMMAVWHEPGSLRGRRSVG